MESVSNQLLFFSFFIYKKQHFHYQEREYTKEGNEISPPTTGLQKRGPTGEDLIEKYERMYNGVQNTSPQKESQTNYKKKSNPYE